MQDDESVPEGQSAAEAADYIAELCGHLSTIARRQGLDMLAHIPEMARLESQSSIREPSEKVPSGWQE
jgi:hypothetical protein